MTIAAVHARRAAAAAVAEEAAADAALAGAATAADGREIFLGVAARRGWVVTLAPSGGLAVRVGGGKEECHYCGFDPSPRQGHDCGMCGGN